MVWVTVVVVYPDVGADSETRRRAELERNIQVDKSGRNKTLFVGSDT